MKVLPRQQFVRFAKDRHIPVEAQFEVTSQCHLHCVMCIRTVLDKQQELSTTEVKQALRDMRDMGVLRIGYTGGEIFTRPDMLELLEYTDELGFKIGLITTGTMLRQHHYDRLGALRGLDRVGISVYALRPKVHAQVTQHDTLRKSLKALFTFKAMGIPVRVNAPVMTITHRDVVTLKHFLKERGIPFFADMSVTATDQGEKFPLQYQVRAEHYPRLLPLLQTPEPGPPACQSGVESLLDPHPFCGTGRNQFAISAHGDLYPCSILRVKFGNLRETPLKEAWTSSPALKTVREHKTTEVLNCKNCEYLNSCQLCLGLTHRRTGDFTAPPSPFCEKNRVQVAEIETVNV